jgi:hypothetical protein
MIFSKNILKGFRLLACLLPAVILLNLLSISQIENQSLTKNQPAFSIAVSVNIVLVNHQREEHKTISSIDKINYPEFFNYTISKNILKTNICNEDRHDGVKRLMFFLETQFSTST